LAGGHGSYGNAQDNKRNDFFFLNSLQGLQGIAGSTIEVKTQGLGQGNGASLAGWCIISIMILWAHGAKGHGAHFIAPMSHIAVCLQSSM
jgi:hypothetical protein